MDREGARTFSSEYQSKIHSLTSNIELLESIITSKRNKISELKEEISLTISLKESNIAKKNWKTSQK